MGNHPESDKALRYIAQLDDARSAGRWADVPELCRKIEKHAPHRSCLTKTARADAQIAKHNSQRPSTATSTAASTAPTELSALIPTLLTAIDTEDHVQDAFQATVCLAWLHYVLDEPGLAIARLPKDVAAVATQMQEAKLSAWTQVCVVKAAFLKGSAQEKTGSLDEAASSFYSILPWLSSNPSASGTLQFKMWSEYLLVHLCSLSDQSSDSVRYTDLAEALQTFRFWAKHSDSAKGTAVEGAKAAKHRRQAWKAYYGTLSILLRHDVPYEPEFLSTDFANENPSSQSQRRLQQRAELKKVEAVYESLLLKDTHFPKARENNFEIEQWTDSVMENWRYLCGPTWTDADLGSGGKEAVGRGVLDILYRAATKTFLSTQILRHLFTVHAYLADLDLAFKAYDSYVEIITRGKDRAEKSGEHDAGLDSESVVLRTSAEAIRVLCRFGSRKEAEKAFEIGQTIENWLEQSEHMASSLSEAGPIQSIETIIEPRSLAVAYCAIGVSLAQWARFTYEADIRAAIQSKAVTYLQKSLAPKLEEPDNLEALYALALVLAETRDIPGSIKVVKRALSPATKNKTSNSPDGVISSGHSAEFGRERKLIPFWHLLALLLTARSEYSAAEQACEAAFEQFGDPTILFGKDDPEAFRSEHLNGAIGKRDRSPGIVDQMERFEKSSILEIKMTQLALAEIVDGPNAAVDGCDELLALYARLFVDPATDQTPKPTASVATMAPPKSAVGTIRGSIFRSKSTAKSPVNQRNARASSVASSNASTQPPLPNNAPAIQVTDEGAKEHHHHHILPHRHHDETSGVQRSPSKLQKRSVSSLRRNSELDAQQVPDLPQLSDGTNNTPSRNNTVRSRARHSSVSSSNRKSIEGQDRSLRPMAHNAPEMDEPPVAGSPAQFRQDTRLPAPFPHPSYIPPEPRFSKIQDRRQRVTLLTSIWLFICGLYMRNDMHDDAKDAATEAYKLAEAFESEVAQESSTSKAFAERSWGCGKSVEELWGDVHAARGQLLLAQDLKHDARAEFERAVLHYPEHPEAIVGLSNVLLDIYCKNIPLERESNFSVTTPSPLPSGASTTNMSDSPNALLSSHTPSAENQLSPPELNRLAARDRAFGLLSTLTKHGAGWDYSEAWYALARAYEESGQLDKTKEVLWWCVELEDTHPIRSWKSVALGGFVL